MTLAITEGEDGSFVFIQPEWGQISLAQICCMCVWSTWLLALVHILWQGTSKQVSLCFLFSNQSHQFNHRGSVWTNTLAPRKVAKHCNNCNRRRGEQRPFFFHYKLNTKPVKNITVLRKRFPLRKKISKTQKVVLLLSFTLQLGERRGWNY